MFFVDIKELNCPEETEKIFEKVNELNKTCKFGRFTYDGNDIMYILTIPTIGGNFVSEKVFKFYFEKVILVLKEASGEILNEQ